MTWNAPTAHRLYEVNDTSWPPIEMVKLGPFTLRRGGGGGQRVSSTSLWKVEFTETDIDAAESAMEAAGQPLLFMVRDNDQALDAALKNRGYFVKDPVTLFAGRSVHLAELDPKGLSVIDVSEPMAVMAEIWEIGGIGSDRLDVMRRAIGAKACFLGRIDDQPAGAAYVACDKDIAMLHALEILPDYRREGLALQMMGAMGAWALRNGAATFSLVVLTENDAACGLYEKLGMVKIGQYHYRKKEAL
ncbi:MAG: GNAT family N-acetyltransferase [Rhodobacteraceae bacterium]|nr:GNAT family N-acetyltransferase [Paracoccaceae bacterium]